MCASRASDAHHNSGREDRGAFTCFVFVMAGHHLRHTVHFNVTDHPTAEHTARQIAEASLDSVPRYPLQDRNCIYGAAFSE